MLRHILLVMLVAFSYQISYLRLYTYGQTTLQVGDMLVSTAGTFRMTLQSAGCTFNVENFNTGSQSYASVGTFTSQSSVTDCNSISL